MSSLLSRRDMRRVRRAARREWLFDPENSHRLAILYVWMATVPLITGIVLLCLNFPWSIQARAGTACLCSALVMAASLAASFVIREDV